jgi:vacuolar-type H+-ATPase subunit H
MHIFLNVIDQQIIINVGSAILLAIIAWGFKLFRDFILTKVKNEKIRDAIFHATDLIETVVLEIEQTIVSSLKKDGKFTKEAQKEVLMLAKSRIMRLLPANMRTTLKVLYDDLDLWITEKIESIVGRNK